MIKFISALFLFVVFCKVTGKEPTQFFKQEEEIISQIAQKLEKAAANDNFSGAILFAKNEHIFLKKAYGMAQRQYNIPNNADTKFNMASEGKLFTSVAIAQLADKGLLSLNDTINKYLSEWVEGNSGNDITIQNLLTHTSGLGSYFDDQEFRLSGSSGRFLEVGDYKTLLKKDTIRFKPGTNQLYSNNGYILLGAIIERVSGENYFDYVQKHIFDPIGMINTGFYKMDEVIPNLAVGFGKEQQKNIAIWKNNLFTNVFRGSPAGGGFSTVNDMFKFITALKDYKLLSKEMTERFFSGKPIVPDAHFYTKDINVHGQKFSIVYSDYGPAGIWNEFGLEIYSQNPLSIGHNGGGMRGIDNDCVIWPDQGYVLLYFSNYTGDGLYYPGPEIKQLINQLLNRTREAV